MIEQKYYMAKLELVYAPVSGALFVFEWPYEPNLTVQDLLQISDIELIYPESLLMPMGIFAKRVDFSTVLNPGDRLEIYRPLTISPKERRRQKALKKKKP